MNQTNQSEEHLRLLSIFHYVFAGILGLFSLFPIIHVMVGLGMVHAPVKAGEMAPMDPRMFGWLFVFFGSAAILIGLTIATLAAISGRCLAARRRLLYCTVIAGIECVFMPIGTVLGVFTLITLSKPEVRELFDAG